MAGQDNEERVVKRTDRQGQSMWAVLSELVCILKEMEVLSKGIIRVDLYF